MSLDMTIYCLQVLAHHKEGIHRNDAFNFKIMHPQNTELSSFRMTADASDAGGSGCSVVRSECSVVGSTCVSQS